MTPEDIKNATALELFDELLAQKKWDRADGEQGLKNLNNIAKTIGYEEERFLYGSAFENFLQDNPGAIGAILGWICENLEDNVNDADSWVSRIRDEIEPEEE